MHFLYLALLGGCLLAIVPLEIGFGLGVHRRWRQLLATLLPVVAVFVGWDVLAIALGDWTYNGRYLVGVRLPGRLPLEELLFFLVVPICVVLTYEAVRTRRPEWDYPTESLRDSPGTPKTDEQ